MAIEKLLAEYFMSNNGSKETIYVDVEDEITSIIDKVKSSEQNIIALVLPKRSAALQSIVNMKLLKRNAQNSKKNIVLITKEEALLPLAGAAEVYVAPNLQTKPEIPPPPSEKQDYSSSESSTEEPPAEEAVAVSAKPKSDEPEPVPDNKKAKKKPKIPNFERFRLRLILGVLAVLLLIGGWALAAVILPKATVTLATDTQEIDTNFNFTADTEVEELDLDTNTIPATRRDFRATDSEKAAATGQKNLGKKADGEVTLQLTSCDKGSVTIPSGTAVSSGNLNFITQDDVTLERALIGDSCLNDDYPDISSETVDVTAQEAGDQYNLSSGKSFKVAGYSDVEGSNEKSIKGGTSKIVKVVTQNDVDKALNAIQARASNDAPDDLEDELQDDGYYPLGSTLQSKDPVITTSPNVGDQAGEVTVTATTSYTMDGVKELHLRKLIDTEAAKKTKGKEQKIQDYTLGEATINLRGEDDSETQIPLSLSIALTAGPELDKDKIKEEVTGKSTEEIKDLFEGRPGINKVDVEYSPFWVKKVPGNTSKVEVDIKNAPDNG